MRTVKLVLSLMVLIGGIYIAFKLVPVYLNRYTFQDAVEEEARFNTYNNKAESEIRDVLYRKARDLDIPLRAEQIVVTRGDRSISIRAQYTVHVDFVIHPVDLTFDVSTKSSKL